MQKIISLFKRDYDAAARPERLRLVYNEVTPGAEWVQLGEGVATRKRDGTCCLVRDGKLYRRYELNKNRKPPSDFEPATELDPVTGKQQGWVPVGDGPEDRWHREAWAASRPEDGTYELIGPMVNGNPEQAPAHVLLRHGAEVIADAPRTFDGLREWFRGKDIEGIVWHHSDGRMVKIKKRDFGLKREE